MYQYTTLNLQHIMQSYKNTFLYISMWLIINIYLYIIESFLIGNYPLIHLYRCIYVSKVRDLGVIFDQFLNFDYHITAICRSTHFHIRNIGKIRNLLSYDACSTIIHALISCRLDYCNSILYNVPKSKTDRLQRLQNQCARILTKSPCREHITPVLMKLHWLKIQDRIIYKMLMLTYKSYYNMAPPYLFELINKKESHVNTRLGTDHHQLIMPPN